MWDNHRLLNRIASTLFALCVLAFGYALADVAMRLPLFSLRSVQVDGPVAHTTREQVEAVAKGEVFGTFFTVDLEATRAVFEKLPWVRRAYVRRAWPDRLEVTLEEHVPLARWHDFALVNVHGEVFEAASPQSLPVLAGPQGSAAEVTGLYEAFRQSLSAIGRVPVEVRLSSRRAWQVTLDDGHVLELGREDVLPRLQRFVAVYPQIAAQLPASGARIDLRYPSGFAIRIPGLKWANRPA